MTKRHLIILTVLLGISICMLPQWFAKSHACAVMLGRKVGRDQIVEFDGDAWSMMGNLVLIAKDRSDLWDFMSRKVTPLKNQVSLPINFQNLLHQLGNPPAYAYGTSALSIENGLTNLSERAWIWYCPSQKLMCVQWWGDF